MRVHEPAGPTNSAPTPRCDERRKGRIDIAVAADSSMTRCWPIAAPRPARLVRSARCWGCFGFASTPIVVALGTSWRSSSSRFAASTLNRELTPVTLPPGRLRLATRPSAIGSPPVANTIGIVVVAALAAIAARSVARRSRSPAADQIPPPAPAAGRVDCRPSEIRPRRSGPRRSLLPAGPGGTPPRDARNRRPDAPRDIRPPASPAARAAASGRSARVAAAPPRAAMKARRLMVAPSASGSTARCRQAPRPSPAHGATAPRRDAGGSRPRRGCRPSPRSRGSFRRSWRTARSTAPGR